MTPATHAGSAGSHSNAPTSTSEPRGSLTTAERNSSKSARKRDRRSLKLPRPRSGPPATTTRVGSPAVWESMTWIRCHVGMGIHQQQANGVCRGLTVFFGFKYGKGNLPAGAPAYSASANPLMNSQRGLGDEDFQLLERA